MAEVGLVRFARVALEDATAAVPVYRSKFSKHVFTQPQLLAVLCLMRYEDWTFREAQVRLSEHRELREALGLSRVPDHTTLHRFFNERLSEEMIERVLAEIARGLPPPPSGGAIVAVDGTGLFPGSVSTFQVKRAKDRGEGFAWRYYLKWIVAVDVERLVVVAQMAKKGPSNDSANLRPLVDSAFSKRRFSLVLADAEFDSEKNHTHVRAMGAQAIIPAKRGKRDWNIQGVRLQMRQHFPAEQYRQRSRIECTFSAIKRKLSLKAPGRSLRTQILQALTLGIAYNIYRIRPRLRFAAAPSTLATLTLAA
ncbi:MAG: transposase [Pseudomonadota bacterium]